MIRFLAIFFVSIVLAQLTTSCVNKPYYPSNSSDYINLENSIGRFKLFSKGDSIRNDKEIEKQILDTTGWKKMESLESEEFLNSQHLIMKVVVDVHRWKNPALIFSGQLTNTRVYEGTRLLYSVSGDKESNLPVTRIVPLEDKPTSTIFFYFHYESILEVPTLMFGRIGEISKLTDDAFIVNNDISQPFLTSLTIGYIVITVGLLVFITAWFYTKRNRKMLLFFALFCVSAGVSSLEFLMPFVNMSVGFKNMITISGALLAPVGFLGFLRYGIEGKKSRFLQIALWLSLIWAIAFVVLIHFYSIDFLYWTIVSITLVLAFVSIIKDKLHKNKEFRIPLLGLTIIFVMVIQNVLHDFGILDFSLNVDFGVLFLVFSLVVYAIQNIRKSNRQMHEISMALEMSQNRLLTLENQNIQTQMEALRSQINPHFLFNSLNTLASLINIDQDRATRFVEEFSFIYRRLLDVRNNKLISVIEELEFLESYLYLQKIRFGKYLTCEINVTENDTEKFIPPLSLQLLVENALKHNEISEDFALNITITSNEGFISVQNPLNPKANDLVHSTGLGLVNLQNRYTQITDIKPFFMKTETHYIARIPMLEED